MESYEDIIPNLDEVKNDLDKLKNEINILKDNIKNIIKKLENVIENMEIYQTIYCNIFTNFNIKLRNYESLQNINEINRNILEEISDINNCNNDKEKINIILDIYNKMNKINHNMNKDSINLKNFENQVILYKFGKSIYKKVYDNEFQKCFAISAKTFAIVLENIKKEIKDRDLLKSLISFPKDILPSDQLYIVNEDFLKTFGYSESLYEKKYLFILKNTVNTFLLFPKEKL